jgi:hypothetical protein
MQQRIFNNERIREVEKYMQQHKEVGFDELLSAKNHQ